MSVVLRPGASVGGFPVKALIGWLRAFPRSGSVRRPDSHEARTLALLGLLRPICEGEPVPCERLKLEMTDAGRGLLSARIGERMTLEAADAALERLVAHAAEPERAARLGLREILVYGSLMRRDPFPADVDAVLVCDAAPEDGFLPADLVRDALGAERDPALRDVHIARAHVPWTDMIRVWRDGLRIDPPEPVPADPAVAAAESARVPGRSVPELDDPDDLVTGGPAGDDHAPPFP